MWHLLFNKEHTFLLFEIFVSVNGAYHFQLHITRNQKNMNKVSAIEKKNDFESLFVVDKLLFSNAYCFDNNKDHYNFNILLLSFKIGVPLKYFFVFVSSNSDKLFVQVFDISFVLFILIKRAKLFNFKTIVNFKMKRKFVLIFS